MATDGVHIVTGDTSGSLRLWDADTLATAGQLQHSGSSVCCVAVSSDLVVSGSTDSMVKLWRLRARECITMLMEHSAPVSCVDVGEEAIATGSDDATVRLWPCDGGASRRTLAHPSPLRAVRMQGDVLATGGWMRSCASLLSPPASSCVSCTGTRDQCRALPSVVRCW